MRLLIGIGERGGAQLLGEVDRILPLRGQELVLAHVIDTGARGELGLLRERHHPARPMPGRRARDIGDAERDAAARALAEAGAVAERLSAQVVARVVGEGEPGRLVSALAADHRCVLVAVASREERSPDEKRGPHSVGHTARFVLDHSPCPVLLVRGATPLPGRSNSG